MSFTHVNVSRDSDVRYWTEELEVTEQQLRHAVRAVGPSAEKVQRFVSLSKMLARNAPVTGGLRQLAQDR
jgi:hypothetical protein